MSGHVRGVAPLLWDDLVIYLWMYSLLATLFVWQILVLVLLFVPFLSLCDTLPVFPFTSSPLFLNILLSLFKTCNEKMQAVLFAETV